MKHIKLTPDQIRYLKVFNGLKSFARQEALDREIGHNQQKTLENELVSLGVLKRDKRGSLRGPSWDDTQAMIRRNTLSLDDIKEALESEIRQLRELEAKDKRLQETDKSYCFYSRDVHDSIRYRREQISKWNKLLSEYQ